MSLPNKIFKIIFICTLHFSQVRIETPIHALKSSGLCLPLLLYVLQFSNPIPQISSSKQIELILISQICHVISPPMISAYSSSEKCCPLILSLNSFGYHRLPEVSSAPLRLYEIPSDIYPNTL